MTKTFKKIISLIVTVVMIMTIGITAFAGATDTYTITVSKNDPNDGSAHEYKIYQILTGDVASSGELSNITWGNNADGTAILAELVTKTGFTSCTTLDDVLAVLDKSPDDSTLADTFASVVEGHLKGSPAATVSLTPSDPSKSATVTGSGYYFIQDNISSSEAAALSKFMLKVVTDTPITIYTKEVVPTLDKNIIENGTPTKYNEASVGDEISFQITSTVPDLENKGYDKSASSKYCFVVTDTLSKGLTYGTAANSNIAPTITVGDGANEQTLVLNTDFTFAKSTAANGETSLKIVFLKMLDYGLDPALKDSSIKITYPAILNENCDTTDTGNPNTAGLIYSNDPSHDYTDPEPGAGDPTGETPDVQTITYTTGFNVIKTDNNPTDPKRLPGATFKIKVTGTSSEQVLTTTEEYTADPNGDFYKLKNGSYTKTAPDPTTQDKYESTTDKYSLTTTTSLKTKPSTTDITATVDAQGYLKLEGLGAGTYVVTETDPPAGYVIDGKDHTVVIECTFNNQGKPVWKYTIDGEESLTATLTVKDRKTTDLPDTGSIGTTIFYAAGAVLLLGGATLLIIKKRTSADKENR